MTRRAFLFAPLAVRQLKGGVHVNGTLTPADSGGLEGYYSLCFEGRCDPDDTIWLAVHPKGFWAKDFQAMSGRQVQVSVFPVAP